MNPTWPYLFVHVQNKQIAFRGSVRLQKVVKLLRLECRGKPPLLNIMVWTNNGSSNFQKRRLSSVVVRKYTQKVLSIQVEWEPFRLSTMFEQAFAGFYLFRVKRTSFWKLEQSYRFKLWNIRRNDHPDIPTKTPWKPFWSRTPGGSQVGWFPHDSFHMFLPVS